MALDEQYIDATFGNADMELVTEDVLGDMGTVIILSNGIIYAAFEGGRITT